MGEPLDIKKWILGLVDPTTWAKSVMYLIMIGVILFIVVMVKNFFFPAKATNTNKPIAVVTPFAKIEKLDQSSIQVMTEKERPWEVGVGVGGLTYDNKTGGFAGGWVKRKF